MVINYQVKSGLTNISDPLLDWDDMLRPLTEGLQGVEKGSLDRFYENNTFYRKPKVVDKIHGSGEIVANKLALNLFPKGHPWKAELPDPYTFASLCEDTYYNDFNELMGDLADVLRDEAQSLSEAGCSTLLFNAPSLLTLTNDADSLDQAKSAFRRIVRGLSVKTYLHLYFDDISPIFESLLDFRSYGLGIDFTSTNLDSLKGKSAPKALICGCVDARNTKMEKPGELAKFVSLVSDTMGVNNISVSTNCDLEFIPAIFANRKITNIGRSLKMIGD